MVALSSEPQQSVFMNQCLLENSAMRGENAALRQALQVNVATANSLFARLLEVEAEHPWITDALRRAEQRCEELETRMVNLADELDARRGVEERCAELEAQVAVVNAHLTAVYGTMTFRVAAPARRAWGTVRKTLAPLRRGAR